MPHDDPAAAQLSDRPPYGIDAAHLAPASTGRPRTLLTLLLIGGPLLAALLGWLGGGRETTFAARTAQAALTVETPGILRSGNWFETRIVVEPAVDVADLTIAIDQPLWRGMSIDTAVPDAEKVETLDDRFTYSFGALDRGKRFVFKLDGQIQPRGFRQLSGQVTARDGDRVLAQVPVAITVLP